MVVVFDIFCGELEEWNVYPGQSKHIDFQNVIAIEVFIDFTFIEQVVIRIANVYFHIDSLFGQFPVHQVLKIVELWHRIFEIKGRQVAVEQGFERSCITGLDNRSEDNQKEDEQLEEWIHLC